MKFHLRCPSCDSTELHKGSRGRYVCNDCEKTSSNPKMSGAFPEQTINKKVLVITSAQNATPLLKGFWKALKVYKEYRDAQMLVIPLRYRNPTSQWTEENNSHDWWDKEVIPYLLTHRLEVNDNLTILGEVKTQPTAVNPLQGIENLSGPKSSIMGHPQIQQKSVPTNPDKLAKMVSSTGTLTRANYTETKAGIKGEFHHEAGAIVVEIVNNKVAHIRHLIADGSSSFYDLDKRFTPKGVFDSEGCEMFVSGDLHGIHHDPVNAKAVWTNKDSLLSKIKPKRQAFHDVLDMHWGSHHHLKDPFLQVEKYYNKKNLGTSEILQTLALLKKLSTCPHNYIIASNHNEHFGRWLKEHDWKKDPANAELYLETSLEYVRKSKKGKSFDPLKYWAEKDKNLNVKFLTRNCSLNVKSIECGYHGDKGPNGARGSAIAFNRIGTKSIIGHGHGPCREKGCIQVGTSSLMNLGYNEGTPSSWMHTHAIIHKNTKVQLVTVVGGEYTAHW